MIDNLLQKRVFGIAAVQNVDASGVQGLGQNLFLIGLALGDHRVDGNALKDFKVDMILDGFMLLVDPQRPGDLGESLQQGAVHGGENPGQVFEFVMRANRRELLTELFDDLYHRLAVEDGRGFRQTAQRGAGDAELSLDFFQLTGLLEGAQGRTNRIKHV